MAKKKQAVSKRKNEGRSQTLLHDLEVSLQELLKGISSKRQRVFRELLSEASDLANSTCHYDAVELINKLLKEYGWLSKRRIAHLHYLRAFTNHGIGKLKEALRDYNYAIYLNPFGEGVYYYDRGLLKEQMGDNEGKEDDFTIGRQINPGWFEQFEEKLKNT